MYTRTKQMMKLSFSSEVPAYKTEVRIGLSAFNREGFVLFLLSTRRKRFNLIVSLRYYLVSRCLDENSIDAPANYSSNMSNIYRNACLSFFRIIFTHVLVR